MRKAVTAPEGAQPKGPYSQGIVASGRLLFVAAQGPIDPATGEVVDGPFEQEALRAFENVRAVVEAAGGRMQDVVRVTVYLPDWSHMKALNTAWERIFHPPYPARTPVRVETPLGRILVDAIAVLPE